MTRRPNEKADAIRTAFMQLTGGGYLSKQSSENRRLITLAEMIVRWLPNSVLATLFEHLKYQMEGL